MISRQHPFQTRLPTWLDLIVLALMALSAPWIAAYVHSAVVFYHGFRPSNAEVGGVFFRSDASLTLSIWDILIQVGAYGFPALLTFLVLLAIRRRAAYCWIVWLGFIAAWTYAFFKMEIPYH